jgi:hypothetical protein
MDDQNAVSRSRTITLSGGEVAIVDDADYALVSPHTWRLNEKGYAQASIYIDGKRFNIRMHRLIMGLRNGDPRRVDHRNGVRLDNRRGNLRICTVADNNRNKRIGNTNTSGLKGVHWEKDRRVWRAQIHVNGRNRTLGRFPDQEQAHQAYLQAAKELHGEFFCETTRNVEVKYG